MQPSAVLLRLSTVYLLLNLFIVGGAQAPEAVSAGAHISNVIPHVGALPVQTQHVNADLPPLTGEEMKAVSQVLVGSNSPLGINTTRTVGQACTGIPTYSTIQAAIDAASPGDVILIEGGVTFTENINVTKNLTLAGGYKGCKSESTDRTTIDGDKNRVIEIDFSVEVTLVNFNIINGVASWGGGIRAQSNVVLRGTNLNIYNNKATIYGGGLRVWGASVVLTDTLISNNVAPMGAGIYANKYTSTAPQLTFVSNVVVEENKALTGDGFGGGIYLSEGTASMAQCADVENNEALTGGGLYIITSTLTMVNDCSGIQYNKATDYGGGLYAQGSSIALGDGAQLSNNSAGEYEISLGYGGGAFLEDSDLLGRRIAINSNTVTGSGGGVYATHGSKLDMDLGTYPCTGPRCSQLSYNTVNEDGGGVFSYMSVVDLRQTYIENNGGYAGSGIVAVESVVYIYNNLFVGNNGLGSVISLLESDLYGSEVTLAHKTTSGATGIDASGGNSVTLARSIIWGYATSIDGTGHFVTCSDIQGGYTGANNINVDPEFVDPGDSNFHLRGNSAAIDQCLGGLSVDVDNDSRPVTYYRPATPYDMGAYEAGNRVGINDSGCAYTTIQDAIDASIAGDTIQLTADTYLESIDISHDLTLEGGYDTDCTTHLTGTTTIDGSTGSGSVVEIYSGFIMLRHLDITGGSITGGIDVWCTTQSATQVTLDDTDVYSNTGIQGGGIWIAARATLTTTNNSEIYNNIASVQGGGISVYGRFVGADSSSDIYGNSAPDGGGIWVTNGGEVLLIGSAVYANTATGATGKGGGIYGDVGSVVTLTQNVHISHQNQAYDGAGIYADHATIFLYDGSLFANIAAHYGGGLYLSNNSMFYATDAYIGWPRSGWGNEASRGAGIYAEDSKIIFEGKIFNNIAEDKGAGIFADNSILQLTNSQIGGDVEGEANQLSSNGASGVGLYLINGTEASIDTTRIISNSFQGSNATNGGGATILTGSTVTLTDSSIEGHIAPSAEFGRGAGLYVQSSSVILDNSQVLSNTAGASGGGIFIILDSALTVINGSLFMNNHALNSHGGGILAGDLLTFSVSNSAFRNNSAGTDGGAVSTWSGLLLDGWMQIEGNTAGNNGGAVFVGGSGDVGFEVTSGAQPSYIRQNHASGDGGALYIDSYVNVPILAVSGYPLTIEDNTSSGNGGAFYAAGQAYLDAKGDVLAKNNSATPAGYGGFAYLTGRAMLGLVAKPSGKPEILSNSAVEGGGVYAVDDSYIWCYGAVFGAPGEGNFAATGDGGAVYLQESAFDAWNCIFQDNLAKVNGGALAAYLSTIDIAVDYYDCDPLGTPCSLFDGNIADSDTDLVGSGGAIYSLDSELLLQNTYLTNNEAVSGGALFHTGTNAHATLENILVTGNSSVTSGSAIRGHNNAYITATHITLADNTGASAFDLNSSVSAWVSNSIAWGNTSGFSGGYVSALCNIDQSGIAGVNVNPEFVTSGSGDYHLQATSPAIDACSSGLPWDLEGVSRPIGSGYDMGAYEGVGDPYNYVYIPVVMRNN